MSQGDLGTLRPCRLAMALQGFRQFVCEAVAVRLSAKKLRRPKEAWLCTMCAEGSMKGDAWTDEESIRPPGQG